jgi:hypothetical protein
MVEIVDEKGNKLFVQDNSIQVVVGPRPNEVKHTHVYALPKEILTKEPPEKLVKRLNIDPGLAELTRPNGTPIWIKGAAVITIGPPGPTDHDAAKAVLVVGSLRQAVRENVGAARRIINEHGGRL